MENNNEQDTKTNKEVEEKEVEEVEEEEEVEEQKKEQNNQNQEKPHNNEGKNNNKDNKEVEEVEEEEEVEEQEKEQSLIRSKAGVIIINGINEEIPCCFKHIKVTKGDKSYSVIELNPKWLKDLKNKEAKKYAVQRYKTLFEEDLDFQRQLVDKMIAKCRKQNIEPENVMFVNKFDGFFSNCWETNYNNESEDHRGILNKIFNAIDEAKQTQDSIFNKYSLQALKKKIALDDKGLKKFKDFHNKYKNQNNFYRRDKRRFRNLVYNKFYSVLEDVEFKEKRQIQQQQPIIQSNIQQVQFANPQMAQQPIIQSNNIQQGQFANPQMFRNQNYFGEYFRPQYENVTVKKNVIMLEPNFFDDFENNGEKHKRLFKILLKVKQKKPDIDVSICQAKNWQSFYFPGKNGKDILKGAKIANKINTTISDIVDGIKQDVERQIEDEVDILNRKNNITSKILNHYVPEEIIEYEFYYVSKKIHEIFDDVNMFDEYFHHIDEKYRVGSEQEETELFSLYKNMLFLKQEVERLFYKGEDSSFLYKYQKFYIHNSRLSEEKQEALRKMIEQQLNDKIIKDEYIQTQLKGIEEKLNSLIKLFNSKVFANGCFGKKYGKFIKKHKIEELVSLDFNKKAQEEREVEDFYQKIENVLSPAEPIPINNNYSALNINNGQQQFMKNDIQN